MLASYAYLGDGSAAAIAGGSGALPSYTGAYALLQAASLGLPTPRILIAPGLERRRGGGAGADRRRGSGCVRSWWRTVRTRPTRRLSSYRDNFGSRRLYLVDPGVKVGTPPVVEPASARVAGVIARTDAVRGYWWSPSNQLITGVVGTTRPVDFRLGDAASRANMLNENEIATIIRENGYRLWGNRTTSGDHQVGVPQCRAHRRRRSTSAILQRAPVGRRPQHHEDLPRRRRRGRQRVPAGARSGRARSSAASAGRILGSTRRLAIAAGKVTFSFDFTPVNPAERVTFRSTLTNDYLEDLL